MTPALQYPTPGRPDGRRGPSALGACRRLHRGLHAYANGLLMTAAAQAAGLLLTTFLATAGHAVPPGLLSFLALLGGLAVLAAAVTGLGLVLAGLVRCAAALNGSRLKALAFPAAYCSSIAALLLVPALIATLVFEPSEPGCWALAAGALFALVGHGCFLVLLRRLARKFRAERLGHTLAAYLAVWLAGCVAGGLLSWVTAGGPDGGSTLATVAGLFQTAVAVALLLWLAVLVRGLRDTVRVAVVHANPPAARTRGTGS